MKPVRLCPFSKPWVKTIAFLLVGFSLTIPGLSQQSFTVEGQVLTDEGATPPTRVNVRVETSDGQVVVDQPADSRGWFQVGIGGGVYRLIVTAPGFQAVQEPLRMFRGSNRYYVTIALKPLVRAKAPGGAVSVSDLSAPKKARKACEKGERAFEKGKLLEAQKELEKAVALHPCYPRALLRLGMIYERSSDPAGAEKAFREAVKCDENLLEANMQLGILLIHQKRYAECAAHAEEALKHSPGAWQLHYQLAASQYGLGLYQEAAQELLKAQSLEPSIPAEIHIRLANVYTQLGAYDKAYAELEAYQQAEPDGRFAAEASAIKQRLETAGLVRPARTRQAQNQPQEK